MVDLQYANAYSEVLEIIKHISQEDYNKIPKDKITLFETNNNKNYKFNYDINKTLDEQNVSKEAKTIIAILFRDYWATDVQRKKIKAKEKYDRDLKEQEMRYKYNPDNLFKKNNNSEIENIAEQKTEIIVYKEHLIKRLINKFIKWINRKF